ncbi:MAG TPA: YciI family protein [Dehalococcoidia bacterium]|nr:YciI family protein [Dehalococcoidia bacterium]
MTREMSMDEIMSRMARLQLYAIFMRPTEKYDTESEEGREIMRRHLQFQLEMEDKGILLAAGPLDDFGRASTLVKYRDSTPAGERLIDASGMYFIVAPSREAAEAIAASEPFEAAGWRTHTLCSWMLNEGTAGPLVRSMIESSQAEVSKS